MNSQLGSTAIGICTKEGVVLAVEKRITSPLLVSFTPSLLRFPLPHHISVPYAYMTLIFQEPSSIEKVMEIDEHMACAMSGLTADAKTLIDHARAETQVRGLKGQRMSPAYSLQLLQRAGAG